MLKKIKCASCGKETVGKLTIDTKQEGFAQSPHGTMECKECKSILLYPLSSLETFQLIATKMLPRTDDREDISQPLTKIASEINNFLSLIEKMKERKGIAEDGEALVIFTGEMLYQLALFCDDIGTDLGDVAKDIINKKVKEKEEGNGKEEEEK